MESIRMGITDEKISHDQGMTSYRCQVLSFEDKMRSWKPGRLLRLKSFYVNGVKLRLQVYPNGDSNANRDFTSIFVDSMSPNDIVIDMDLSMGRTKLSNTSMKVQAYGGLGWARFYDHNQHNFVAQMDSDSEPENHDEDLEIVWNIKKVWKVFDESEKVETIQNLESIQRQITNLQTQFESKINNLEVQMKQMMEVKNNNGSRRSSWGQLPAGDRHQMVPKPECPVCMEEMSSATTIVQCGAGHLLCWGCSQKPEMGNRCPSCRGPFVGRAHGMEAYLKTVFG